MQNLLQVQVKGPDGAKATLVEVESQGDSVQLAAQVNSSHNQTIFPSSALPQSHGRGMRGVTQRLDHFSSKVSELKGWLTYALISPGTEGRHWLEAKWGCCFWCVPCLHSLAIDTLPP